MTHKCFQCNERFKSSGELVGHMKEAHSSFVKDAQDKIDRSKERSAVVNAARVNTLATCPFCQLDCQTRKKLMKHLEYEHKDDEQDDEPQLKIIRLTDEYKRQFINHFSSQSSSQDGASTSNPQFVENILKAIKSEADANVDEKMKLSATVKLSEKRYKCFWCEASFRKRGKLMDHIDMFHKANKHQSEIEAELLQGSTGSTSTSSSATLHMNEKPVPKATVTLPDIKPVISSPAATVTVEERKVLSPNFSVSEHVLPKKVKEICKFKLLGSICEKSRLTSKVNDSPVSSCKFYSGPKGNPLIGSKPSLPSPQLATRHSRKPSKTLKRENSDIPHSISNSPTSYSTISKLPRSQSKSCTKSPEMKASPTTTASSTLMQIPHQANTVRSMQRHMIASPRMPIFLPPTNLYINHQNMMLLDSQRSPLNSVQYLPYFQQMAQRQQSYHNPDVPLDLSTPKF